MNCLDRTAWLRSVLALAFSAAMAVEPLNTPPAPFVPAAKPQDTAADPKPAKPYLDAGRLTFVFGSKRVVVAPCGTFVVMSGGRKLADS